MLQVSEQQLNDAIAQAVENSKLRKEKSQWSIDGEILLCSLFIFHSSGSWPEQILFLFCSTVKLHASWTINVPRNAESCAVFYLTNW